MRLTFVTLRVVVAVLSLAAIGVQVGDAVTQHADAGGTVIGAAVVNTLGYFTIQSTVLGVVVLLFSAGFLLRKDTAMSRWLAVVRVGVVTYLVVTAVVYNLLLRDRLPWSAPIEWDNEVLHVLGPAYLVVDWLVAPGRRPVAWRHVLTVVAYPIVWVVVTLLRGPTAYDPDLGTNYWYPYPFLNPVTAADGWVTVGTYVAVLTVFVSLLATGVIATSRGGSS